MEILFILMILVLLLGGLTYIFFGKINSENKSTPPPVKSVRPRKADLTEIYNDIVLEPYGCFSSLDEKFFSKRVNPYSNGSIVDSGIIIRTDEDMRTLINKVITNGFDQYGYKILSRYDNDPEGYSKKMSIKEIGILGKLAGYNFISIYKINENTRGKVYLSYSPPMNSQIDFNASSSEYTQNVSSSDLPKYTLTPKLNNYTNEEENAPGKDLSCGYPCLPGGNPMTFTENGVTKQYMCGSVAYPNIRTPPRFAVYKINERA